MMNMTSNNVFNTMFNNIKMQENTGDNAGGGSTAADIKTVDIEGVTFNESDVHEFDAVIKYAKFVDHTQSDEYDEETDAAWSIYISFTKRDAWAWDYDEGAFRTNSNSIFLNQFEIESFLKSNKFFQESVDKDGKSIIDHILLDGDASVLEGMHINGVQIAYRAGSKGNVNPFSTRIIKKKFDVTQHDIVRTYIQNIQLDIKNVNHIRLINNFINAYDDLDAEDVVDYLETLNIVQMDMLSKKKLIKKHQPEAVETPKVDNSQMMAMMMQMMAMMNGNK